MRKFINKFKQFQRKEDGATAVEFAFVAVPFTFLLLGIVEISLFFAASNLMHGATSDAARLVKTGQIQQDTSGDPQALFEAAICDHAKVFADCDKIQYEVITMNDFGAFGNYDPTYDENGDLNSQGFNAGGTNDTVLIRTSYLYEFALPFVKQIFGEGPSGKKRIETTIVLQVEPYDLEEEGGTT